MDAAAFVTDADTNFDNAGVYAAIPAGANMEFIPAQDKNELTTGSVTDGDVCIMTLDLM
jgi:hypothetical protein